MGPIRCDQENDAPAYYGRLVHQLSEFAIFLMDEQGTISNWNPSIGKLLGYTEAEFIGQPATLIFTPEDRANGIDRHELETAREKGAASDIRWHLRKDGSRLFVDGVLASIRGDSGELLGFAKFMRDATDRKLEQDERERLLADLARSNEDLGQFAHVISHDLQAPLRMIKTYAQLLESRCLDQLDGDGRKYLSVMLQGAANMENLIQGVLAYAQVAGQQPVARAPVALGEVVEQVSKEFHNVLDGVAPWITHTVLPTVRGDRSQFFQLFQNLINNAIKYGDKDGALKIQVDAVRGGAGWTISVADNGPGIEQKYQDEIFTPFRRLHGADVPGTGMGLSICKKIVERHGGRIWVESRAGEGATFYFTLPDGAA